MNDAWELDAGEIVALKIQLAKAKAEIARLNRIIGGHVIIKNSAIIEAMRCHDKIEKLEAEIEQRGYAFQKVSNENLLEIKSLKAKLKKLEKELK